jgi:hypothetical protein
MFHRLSNCKQFISHICQEVPSDAVAGSSTVLEDQDLLVPTYQPIYKDNHSDESMEGRCVKGLVLFSSESETGAVSQLKMKNMFKELDDPMG